MDSEIILDRLFDTMTFVIPEIASATRVLLLRNGTDSERAEMIAKCEHHVRSEIAEAGSLVQAIISTVDYRALDDGQLRLVATGLSGRQVVVSRSLEEIGAVAHEDWDRS